MHLVRWRQQLSPKLFPLKKEKNMSVYFDISLWLSVFLNCYLLHIFTILFVIIRNFQTVCLCLTFCVIIIFFCLHFDGLSMAVSNSISISKFMSNSKHLHRLRLVGAISVRLCVKVTSVAIAFWGRLYFCLFFSVLFSLVVFSWFRPENQFHVSQFFSTIRQWASERALIIGTSNW